MNNLHSGPSIDASCQVHLAKQLQRRRFLEFVQKETKLSMAAIFVNGPGRNVTKNHEHEEVLLIDHICTFIKCLASYLDIDLLSMPQT